MQWSSFTARARRATAYAVCLVVLACALPALASAADYVALGDSYSSGTGTRSYFDTNCERSVSAYPYLIKGSLGSSFSFQACGGAKTQDVINNQLSALSADTDYVTMSIGGNDAGFSSVITQCAKPWPYSCDGDVNTAQSFIANTLPGRLDNLYNLIRSKAPNAVVAIVGYPRLFNGDDCNALTFFSSDEETRLNQTADQLADVERSRARAHGFTFVDVRQAFIGHAVCDNPEWLNGLSNPTSESYHPNATGHASGYAPTVRAALLAAPDPTVPVAGNGRIAFASTRTGNSDIFVVNPDGQFPVDLTNDPSADIDPAWSPDGTKIAFASNRDGDNEIYVMNGDGTGVTKLTSNTANDQEPTWSPNGAYIAFRSDRTGNNEVFTMTAAGGSQTNITNNSASDFAPDWSPDGAEIAFQRFTSGTATGQGNEVLKANANGQGQLNLTNNASTINDGRPSWSPDGATIAFHSNRVGSTFKIFTMGATGGTATQRSTGAGNDTKPVWAPKGNFIAFTSTRDGNDEIYTMTPTGGSITNRTAIAGSDANPSWQPDSTPPATTIAAQPSGAIADTTPTFTFSSSELGSRLECSVDNGAYATCTSPFTTPALGQGPHSLAVRAVDVAGNVDDTPAVRTFTVDTVAPTLSVSCTDTVPLLGAARATVTAADGGSGFAAGSDPTGIVDLITSVPGRQTYSVTATDLAGNATTKSCDYDVRYPDPGVPQLTGGATPNAGAFSLGWAASADTSYPLRYTLQRRATGGDWEDVATDLVDPARAFTVAAAADEGTWRFRVRGVDAVNDTATGWTDASDPVVVDTSGPRPPAITPTREAEDTVGGWFRDGVTVTTAERGDPDLRDGSAPSGVDPASVAGPEALTATTTVRRTVRDRVGNASDEASLEVRVDDAAPTVDVACPATAYVLQDVGALVSAADAQSGLHVDPSGTVGIDTAHAGPQEVVATAVDRVGHETTGRCTVDVEYPAPGAPATADGASTNDGDFAIRWARSAPADYPVRYVLERRDAADGDWQPVADDLDGDSYTFHAGDRADEGTWRYRVQAVDGEHRSPWSEVSDAVTVDQTGPAAPAVTADREPDFAGDGGWFRDTVTVATADQGDPALRDGSPPSGVDADSVAAPQALDHTTTVRRTVRDRVGNASDETALRVQVDADAPTVALDCASPVDLLSEASVRVSAADAGSGLREDPSGTVAIDTSRIGEQVVERTAVDNVGHATTERCTVDVRYPAPGAPKVADGKATNNGDFAVSWTRSAPATYPIRYALERRDAGGAWQRVADGLDADTYTFHAGDAADEGTWRFRVRGTDGDVQTPWSGDSDPVVVDQTAPAAPSVTADRAPEYAGDGGWFRDTVTVATAGQGDPALRDGSAGSGVDPDSVAAPQALAATATVSRTVRDRAGNRSAPTSLRAQVDADAPALTLDCPASVVLRGTGSVTVRASDAGSGLKSDPSGTVAIDTGKVGLQTITRTAVDNVGHTRTVSCDVRVRYDASPLEQPVNASGSSIFKLGSTVPLKLTLADAAGAPIADAKIVVEMERLTTSVLGTVVEETIPATPTNGKEFTDSGSGRYQYNLSTKPLTTGTWNIKLTFDDGTVQRTRISLR
jgi:lysophospholipase L1-like esterase